MQVLIIWEKIEIPFDFNRFGDIKGIRLIFVSEVMNKASKNMFI